MPDHGLFDYLVAPVAILSLLFGWTQVQRLARRFAERHPEFGPAREEGGGCGSGCSCSGKTCAKQPTATTKRQRQEGT